MSPALGVVEPMNNEAVEVNATLQLLLRTQRGGTFNWLALTEELSALRGPVVIDAGTLPVGEELLRAATHNLLVIRPCYLALRRASTSLHHETVACDGVIVVNEEGRALTPHDVSSVLKLPVRATLLVDSAIARAVDAGLLASRVPVALSTALASFVDELSIVGAS